ATTVASGHATLATKRTLLLTWAGLPPAGSHQLCLAHSFDHLVGTRLQREWNGEPQRLRGLEIDHQFEFRGLLDRQVGRLFAFENPPGVDAGEAIRIGNAGSVTDQPAGHYKLAQIIHGRHGMARRQLDQLIAPAAEECIAVEDYRVDTLLGEAR